MSMTTLDLSADVLKWNRPKEAIRCCKTAKGLEVSKRCRAFPYGDDITVRERGGVAPALWADAVTVRAG